MSPLSLQPSLKLHRLRSFVTTSLHLRRWPPAVHLPCSGAQTRYFFGTRSSFMHSKCPRRQNLFLMSAEDTLCCLASLWIAVFLFSSRKDMPRMILRHLITKLCIRFCCGTVSAAHSRPYMSTGTMTRVEQMDLGLSLDLMLVPQDTTQ